MRQKLRRTHSHLVIFLCCRSNAGNINGGITFGPYVSAICLPPVNFVYSAGANLTISGWGKMGYESVLANSAGGGAGGERPQVKHLQEAIVPIIHRDRCSDTEVRPTVTSRS